MSQESNRLIQPFLPLSKRDKINKLEKADEKSVDQDEDIHALNRHFKYELHSEEALMLSYGILD